MTTLTSKKRITVRDVYGVPEKLTTNDMVCDALTVIGVLHSCRDVDDKYNPGSVRFELVGEFEATNIKTGEIFYATKLYLPEAAHVELLKSFKDSKFQSLKFSYLISYKNSTNRAGYEYICKSLIKPFVSDPLSDLRPKLKGKGK